MDDTAAPDINAQADEIKEATRSFGELVPVSAGGVQIHDLAQQIDYAKTMARAKAALPKHLQDNVGDCLAIIDISSRAGLSPYMVANHTYVQNNKLCFESQLYHAFVQASGLLRGDLSVAYEGEGGERVCVITGTLKVDPNNPRVYRSPKLKDRHPGYVLKKSFDDNSTSKNWLTYEKGEQMRAAGEIQEGAQLFSRGSPLWVTKPDVQQFYDTSRDWVRMFAPRATLGISTPDEFEDFPELKEINPLPSSGLHDRLRGADVSREEGHKDGQVAQEIKDSKNGKPAEAQPEKPGRSKGKGKGKDKPPAIIKPKTPAEWVTYCTAWIEAGTDDVAMRKRWDEERQLRTVCGVVSEERDPVMKLLNERCDAIKAKKVAK